MLVKCSRTRYVFLRISIFLGCLFFLIWYFKSFVNPPLTEKEQILEDKLQELEDLVIPNLGDLGEPAHLTGRDREDGEKALKTVALNTVLSDRMPLNRVLRDVRHANCSSFNYKCSLKASVIIIFYNELLSVILRTVWSVILQTPVNLLQEIILVDDCSTDEDLYNLLEYYLRTRLKGHNIRLVPLKLRVGLIKARLSGAKAATGDVLIFLDAHCEVVVGWAEPLLSRIEEERTAVLVPVNEVIEPDTLKYSSNGMYIQVGGFTWGGHFTWINVQDPNDQNKLTPIKSPTMSGGIFAVEKKYFWEIGSYDEQMDGWGGENLEMSFRIWQCGGRIEAVPCSRVGHIYRDFHPYTIPGNKDTHKINTARLAYVWMDDYKRLFFMYERQLENNSGIGDLTARKQLRQKLGCKSFKWYLDNVYPEKYVIDENVKAFGQVKNTNKMCLDDLQLEEGNIGLLGLYPCHHTLEKSQFFSLSAKGQLRKEEFCAEPDTDMNVYLMECLADRREQHWEYFVKNRSIYNVQFRKCLSSNGVKIERGLIIENCEDRKSQYWTFTNLNKTVFVS